jgi:peptidoglycan/LPS O-acetylase OafA/YrhL
VASAPRAEKIAEMTMGAPQTSCFPRALALGLEKSNLPSLDGLRAIAVLLVVLYHFGIHINGGLGVTMFFTLSGFLITWLLLKEERRWGSVSLRLFYVRRSLRIFPAFYVFWFVSIIGLGVLRSRPVIWPHAITAFLYVGNYYQAVTGDWNGPLFHTWSLSIEEQYYLLWPAAFIALKTNQARLKALLIAIPCIWIYRIVLVGFGVHEGYIYAALDTRADQLLVGCALAIALFLQEGGVIWRALTVRGGLAITLGLLAASSIATVAWGSTYRNTVGFITDPLLTAALLVQGIAAQPAWLNWSPVRYVGRISYSVYLYHMLAISSVGQLRLYSKLPYAFRLAASVAACIAVASVSYYVIERPFLIWKERVGQRRKAANQVSGA